MQLKKKSSRTPRISFAEVRPNAGTPAAAPTTDWAVSHQSAFPWLNTVTFLAATPTRRGEEGQG